MRPVAPDDTTAPLAPLPAGAPGEALPVDRVALARYQADMGLSAATGGGGSGGTTTIINGDVNVTSDADTVDTIGDE